MWQREEFILLHKINCNIFKLHYLLLKRQSYKKRTNKYSKIRWKVKLRNELSLYFDSILEVFSSKHFDQFVFFFFFCCKVFWLFFFELSIFQTYFNFSNNGIKYFPADCFFSAHLPIVSINLFTGSARISQKRFVLSEVQLWDGRSFFISLWVFYLILFPV